MPHDIKFGIVITTYLRPDGKTPFYLKRALNSVLKQTHKNYKVFLIGDKYEDTKEFETYKKGFKQNIICKNLDYAYEREKYSYDKYLLWTCGGLNATNYGVDLALQYGYDYICRLDHDDYWEPTHLENFQNAIINYKSDFICSKSTHFNNKVLPNIANDSEIFEYLPEVGNLVKSSTCINQKVIPLSLRNVFEETGKKYPSDADLWIRLKNYLINNNLKSYCINKITCHHDEEGYIKKT